MKKTFSKEKDSLDQINNEKLWLMIQNFKIEKGKEDDQVEDLKRNLKFQHYSKELQSQIYMNELAKKEQLEKLM